MIIFKQTCFFLLASFSFYKLLLFFLYILLYIINNFTFRYQPVKKLFLFLRQVLLKKWIIKYKGNLKQQVKRRVCALPNKYKKRNDPQWDEVLFIIFSGDKSRLLRKNIHLSGTIFSHSGRSCFKTRQKFFLSFI